MPGSDLGRFSRFRLDAHRFYNIIILEIDYEMANFVNNNDNLWNSFRNKMFLIFWEKKKKKNSNEWSPPLSLYIYILLISYRNIYEME